jgi:hypothetical protein
VGCMQQQVLACVWLITLSWLHPVMHPSPAASPVLLTMLVLYTVSSSLQQQAARRLGERAAQLHP